VLFRAGKQMALFSLEIDIFVPLVVSFMTLLVGGLLWCRFIGNNIGYATQMDRLMK
jgi:hypothetical protein